MQGSLSQISLNDILLLATEGKKSGVLKLSRGKEAVEVYLSNGEFIHATCPIGDGEKALLYPVTWNEGTFSLGPNGSPPGQTITKPSAEILAEVRAMSQEWERILQIVPGPRTVFRLADLAEERNGPITISPVGWRILCKLDGTRDVQAVAELLRVPYAYAAKAIYNLHQSGLVEVSATPRGPRDITPPGFFELVTRSLAHTVGPMAALIVREQIAALGESQDNFPNKRLPELINLLAQEIEDERAKTRFQQDMGREISTLKRIKSD